MNHDIISRLARFEIAENQLTTHPPGPCVLAYIRVSTKKQVEEGHSVEGQKKIIDGYIANDSKLAKWPIMYFTDEAKSGRTMVSRESFEAMRDIMKSGDVIITWNLTRLGRNNLEMTNFVADLQSRSIGLILTDLKFDTTTAVGDMLLSLLIAVAQFERKQASERTRAMMQQRADQGYVVTRPPYGFRVEKDTKKLIPDQEEQAIIDLMTGWIFRDPTIKDAEITRRLQERFEKGEIKMRKANCVHQATVSNIIKRHKLREALQKLT